MTTVIDRAMKRLSLPLALVVAVCTLSACGGGGGGGGSGGTTPPPPPPPPQAKTFSVTLEDIDVRRSSNGQRIVVDTTNVTSGTLTLQP